MTAPTTICGVRFGPGAPGGTADPPPEPELDP